MYKQIAMNHGGLQVTSIDSGYHWHIFFQILAINQAYHLISEIYEI